MRIQVKQPKGFSLAAASRFYEGFIPGSGMAVAEPTQLTLAFRLDGSFEAIAVALSHSSDAIALDIAGTRDELAVVRQVTRILGLDADGDAWSDVGRRDPVVGRLQSEFEGFFTAAKSSPYDAATWGILAARSSIRSAAKLKMQIARTYGDAIAIGHRLHHVFPSPHVVSTLRQIPGLAQKKLVRLRAVADAALEGRLDPDRLRAMAPADALADLQRVRGVGAWTASHIYFRGAAPPDGLPMTEPRVLRGWALAAGVPRPTLDAFARAAERWRPFRMWIAILLARHLATSGEWNAPGIARERRLSRRLRSA